MKAIKKNLFLATVLVFAVSSSSCQLLSGILPMLGGGMGLTDDDNQNSLSLTGSQDRVKNGYRIVGGALPQQSRQEGALYSAFDQ
ncbi:MAG: hypothetical protein WCL28_00030 [bacterium]